MPFSVAKSVFEPSEFYYIYISLLTVNR